MNINNTVIVDSFSLTENLLLKKYAENKTDTIIPQKIFGPPLYVIELHCAGKICLIKVSALLVNKDEPTKIPF